MSLLDKIRGKKESANYTVRVFECKRGELTIRGTEYRPVGENLPVAIVSHGFIVNQGTVKKYAMTLAEMGYAAYCYDFNGGSAFGSKSDGKTTDMSVLTEIQDLEAVIAYAQSLPYNSDELLLMGCSQGGFVSALTAARRPDLKVNKLVLFYPALCIPDDARSGKMLSAKFDPDNVPEVLKGGIMKLGRCYVEDVKNMDAISEIKSYTGPVLIIHGSADKIVDLRYSKEAQAAYANAQLTVIDGAPHGFFKKNLNIALDKLRAFAAL